MSASKIKIHLLHTGSVYVSQGVPYGNASMLRASGIFEPKKSFSWIPVSAYFIEHPKGRVLFDTGWGRAIAPAGGVDVKAQSRQMGRFLTGISKGSLPAGESAAEQLLRLGYSPADLDYVILSHLDVDHVSGLRDVAAARNLLVSEPEYESAMKLKNRIRYNPALWRGLPLEKFTYADSGIGPFGRSYDLFDDGSVLLVDIAGHTDGLCGMLVRHEGRFVLMFADGGYSSRSWQELILPGPFSNKSELRRSLEWIREMSLDKNCVASWATHDPNLSPQTIEL